MNVVIVEPDEVRDGRVVLAAGDRRSVHLRDVIGLEVGKPLRAGIANRGLGTATIVRFDDAAIELNLEVGETPAQLPIDLLLAIPRPKVLSRVVEIAASFGIARIDLTNAWRVAKQYLDSPRMAPASLAHAARLGAEQGGTTRLPEILVHKRLMPLLDGGFTQPIKLLAHPDAPPLESIAITPDARIVLAIGAEGGWIQREVDTFVERGFSPVSLGAPILRTEAAVAALLGQILVVRRQNKPTQA